MSLPEEVAERRALRRRHRRRRPYGTAPLPAVGPGAVALVAFAGAGRVPAGKVDAEHCAAGLAGFREGGEG